MKSEQFGCKVTSKDSTSIVYDQIGKGPALIMVSGATGVRSHAMFGGLVEQLASHFTVYNYDRRGRGDSGDTRPYAILREVEDIEAVIDAAGSPVSLYGISSGAVLALEAASHLATKVKKLALYEPPFIVDDSRAPLPDDYVDQLNAAVAAGDRGTAVEIFLTQAILLPDEYLASMRSDPSWADLEAVAHTIAYDGTIMGDTMSGAPLSIVRTQQWVHAAMPTLVMTGGNSEPFFHTAAKALVKVLPNASHQILAGQDHAVTAEALVPALVTFFED